MKYFVISDIHGHYRVLRTSLQQAEYQSDNPNHHLLVLGDLFDRGHESDHVFEYLYQLYSKGKASILIGNHDTYLRDFLDGRDDHVAFNVLYNGFGATLENLSQQSYSEDAYSSMRQKIHDRYPQLLPFLQSLPLYIEIGDYIFVHGGIDGGKLDWKTMSSERDFIWSREHELPRVEGKTVVAGHTRVATIRVKTNNYELLHLQSPKYFDILYQEGKILIDRFVEVSKELNVLVLDI